MVQSLWGRYLYFFLSRFVPAQLVEMEHLHATFEAEGKKPSGTNLVGYPASALHMVDRLVIPQG